MRMNYTHEVRLEVGEFFVMVVKKRGRACPVKHCNNDGRYEQPGSLCGKCAMRLWRARNPARDAFNNLKKSAVGRKIPFTVTLEEFRELCARTLYAERRGKTQDGMQIDRIDNMRGYEIGNLAVISCSENTSKGNRERWVYSNGKRVRAVEARAILSEPQDDGNRPF